MCPYSETQFYRLKPILVKYKELFLQQNLEKSVDMLKAASPQAVKELISQLKYRQTGAINKAANDILDRTIPKNKETMGISVKDGNKEIKFIVTRGE